MDNILIMATSRASTSFYKLSALCSIWLFLLFSTPAAWADAGDISNYVLQTFSLYNQSSVTTPAYAFSGGRIEANESSAGSVPATPTVQFPGGATHNLSLSGTTWSYGQTYGSTAALNAAWPSGGYLYTIPTTTAPTTTFTPTLNQVAVVTTIPTLGNTSWSGGILFLDHSVSNTITWNVNDATFYNFTLFGNLGDNVNLSGNASDLSLSLSAGTLVNGESYNGSLALINESDDFSQVPGVEGVSQTYTQTSFTLHVVPEPFTYGLVLSGLGLLRLVAKRKQIS